MEKDSYDEHKLGKTVTGGGYIYSENKYLETLVLKIRGGGPEGESAKKDFRETFEVDAMVFIDRRLKKMFHRDMAGEDTQQMAYEVAEKLLQEVEKGNFDFCDGQGNILLNEKGEPKIRNLGGALWSKMNFIFMDLLKKKSFPSFDPPKEEITQEQRTNEHLKEIMKSVTNDLLRRRLAKKIGWQNKLIKEQSIEQQIVLWCQDRAKDMSKDPFELLLEKNERQIDKKEMVWDCFKSLRDVQKQYIVFLVCGLRQVEVSEMFGVKPPSVTQALKRARKDMKDCLQGKGIKTFTEIYGG